MSDISDLSSDSSITSWNRDFEPEFIADFMINQSTNQSINPSPSIHSYHHEPMFINDHSYDFNQSISPSFHPINHDASSPVPKRTRQSTSESINQSINHVINQSTNQVGHQPINQSINQSDLPSGLSNVIAVAKSITAPTLTSINQSINQSTSTNSSKRKRRNSSESTNPSTNQSTNQPLNRAEVKKAKHREIDAVRRQREATVITRLQELNSQHTVLFEQCSSLGINQSINPSTHRPLVTGQAKDKVSVLEESADKTAALQELCRKLSETCAKQQQSINDLTDHVTSLSQKLQVQADDALTYNQSTVTSTTVTTNDVRPINQSLNQHFSELPPHVQEYLGQIDRSFALYSSCFLQATVCIMIISVKTGRLIDANSCFFRTSGWTADQILGRVLTAPLEFVLGRRSSSMTDVERLLDEQTRPLVRRNGQLVPARRVPQYPRSKQKFKDLVTGAADQIEAIWRSELADGNMYEVKNICYAGKRETVEDERGRVMTRPVHVVFACSALDGIKLT